VEELAIDSRGRIVAGGCRLCRYTGEFAVVRLLSDGTLDPSFGGDGIARTYFHDTGSVGGIALDRADQIVVAGGTNDGFYVKMNLARYLSGDEPCLDIDGERAFLRDFVPRLIVRGIGNATSGDESIDLAGDLLLPEGMRFADLVPLETGARAVLLSRTGATVADAALPPGALVNGTGWSTNRAGTRWTYRERVPRAPLGRARLTLVASLRDERRVRIRMRGTRATLPIAAGDEPLEVGLSLDLADPLAGGACGFAAFEAHHCARPGGSRARLVCTG